MKTRHSITAALFLTTLTLASPAAAQNVAAGSESSVVLALTLATPIPDVLIRDAEGQLVLDQDEKPILDYSTSYATVKNDIRTDVVESGGKLKIEKYGNKEFLTDLLNEGGYFPDGETSIKGWILKQVEGGEYTNTYLMKKGVEPVRLPDNLVQVAFYPGQSSGKFVSKFTGPVEGFYGKASVTGSLKTRGPLVLSLNVPEKIGMGVQGIAAGTVKAAIPDVTNVTVGWELPPVVELVAVKASGVYGNGSKSTGSFTVDGSFSLSSPLFVPNVYALPNFGGN